MSFQKGHSFSSAPRYDRFDTSPCWVVRNFDSKLQGRLKFHCTQSSRKMQEMRGKRRKNEISGNPEGRNRDDFESAPLWPLRYLSILHCAFRNPEKNLRTHLRTGVFPWKAKSPKSSDFLAFSSVFTVLRDRVFHTTLMISSQPRYDHFDTSPY